MRGVGTWAAAAVALAAVVFSGMAIASVAAQEPGRLYITGVGSSIAAYDMVQVTVEIDTEERSTDADTASRVQSKQQSASQDFLAQLEQSAGVPPANVTTSGLSLNPITNWTDGQSVVVGYKASSTVIVDVSTEDPGLLPKIYELALSFQSFDEDVQVSVQNFNPYVSDELKDAMEQELFDSAMARATKRALMFAKGAGRSLGPVIRMSDSPLSEDSISDPPQPLYSNFDNNARAVFAAPEADMGAGDNGAGISLGKGQKLQKSVYLVYSLLDSNSAGN